MSSVIIFFIILWSILGIVILDIVNDDLDDGVFGIPLRKSIPFITCAGPLAWLMVIVIIFFVLMCAFIDWLVDCLDD